MSRTPRNRAPDTRSGKPPLAMPDLPAAEPLRNRMIATAYYRDGYSIRDIARAWGLSRANIGKIVLRVRKHALDRDPPQRSRR